MPLVLLLGGVRSGKSRMAVRLAAAGGRQVVVVATGGPGTRRWPSGSWQTVEEPLDLEGALAGVPEEACALVDCLTLWVSNLLERSLSDPAIEDLATKAAALAASRAAGTVAVTNEVGWGVVPDNALARRFSDVLGRVNAIWAEHADRSALVVAGRILPLIGLEVMADDRAGE